jgi:hypothetical protein
MGEWAVTPELPAVRPGRVTFETDVSPCGAEGAVLPVRRSAASSPGRSGKTSADADGASAQATPITITATADRMPTPSFEPR